MNKLPVNINFTQWADQFSQMMVNETFKIFQAQTKNKGGKEAALYLCMCFLAKFIGALMLEAMKKQPDPLATQNEVAAEVIAATSEAKARVQDAVAAGFAGAMKVFTGNDLEYFCQVKPVPEPVNKKPI